MSKNQPLETTPAKLERQNGIRKNSNDIEIPKVVEYDQTRELATKLLRALINIDNNKQHPDSLQKYRLNLTKLLNEFRAKGHRMLSAIFNYIVEVELDGKKMQTTIFEYSQKMGKIGMINYGQYLEDLLEESKKQPRSLARNLSSSSVKLTTKSNTKPAFRTKSEGNEIGL